MFLEILAFLYSIGEALCVSCYKYNGFTVYFTYCGGFCSGSYGNQYCYYYYDYYSYYSYDVSGGAIAGIVIGVLIAISIFVIVVVICVRAQNRRQRSLGAVIGPGTRNTHNAVTNATHTTGHMQPVNNVGYQTMPPQYNTVYPPTYQSAPAYPPAYPPQPPQGYSSPAQPQYTHMQPPQGCSSPAQPLNTPVYNQPVFSKMPRTNI